jgi:Cwf15/Cwc15 cell cycle control protein
VRISLRYNHTDRAATKGIQSPLLEVTTGFADIGRRSDTVIAKQLTTLVKSACCLRDPQGLAYLLPQRSPRRLCRVQRNSSNHDDRCMQAPRTCCLLEYVSHQTAYAYTATVYYTVIHCLAAAHRPTIVPAKGHEEQGGMRIFVPSRMQSAKDMAAHTKLKFR